MHPTPTSCSADSEAQHLFTEGLADGAQILRYDRAREQTDRQLMRLHYQAGDRTAAIYQYKACVKALEDSGQGQPRVRLRSISRFVNAAGAGAAHAANHYRSTNVTVTDRGEVYLLQQLDRFKRC